MEEEEYYREVKTRERIMQVFLIISGFLLAYSNKSIIPLFNLFILFAILYYIYLTRTKNDYFINFWGFLSSYTFSLLLLHFMNTQLENAPSNNNFISSFIVLTAVFTFAFLSPRSSKQLVSGPERFFNWLESKYPALRKITPIKTKHLTLFKIIAIIIYIIAIICIYILSGQNFFSLF